MGILIAFALWIVGELGLALGFYLIWNGANPESPITWSGAVLMVLLIQTISRFKLEIK